MAAWHARGDTLDISVNVSGRQLDDDRIIDDIRDALEPVACASRPDHRGHRDRADAQRRGHRGPAPRDQGSWVCRIAVDDFGTGYSSLAYLQQFPVDCLKIDRAFTSAVTTSPESQGAHRHPRPARQDLGLTTLAEGVETTDEMDILRPPHVDQAQGFLMAQPLDPETLEDEVLAPHLSTEPSEETGPVHVSPVRISDDGVRGPRPDARSGPLPLVG